MLPSTFTGSHPSLFHAFSSSSDSLPCAKFRLTLTVKGYDQIVTEINISVKGLGLNTYPRQPARVSVVLCPAQTISPLPPLLPIVPQSQCVSVTVSRRRLPFVLSAEPHAMARRCNCFIHERRGHGAWRKEGVGGGGVPMSLMSLTHPYFLSFLSFFHPFLVVSMIEGGMIYKSFTNDKLM